MRKHYRGQQGKCLQCAKNIQCCALILTPLAMYSVYSSKQNKTRTQTEVWATIICTILHFPWCSYGSFQDLLSQSLLFLSSGGSSCEALLMVCRLDVATFSGEAWGRGHEEGWELKWTDTSHSTLCHVVRDSYLAHLLKGTDTLIAKVRRYTRCHTL